MAGNYSTRQFFRKVANKFLIDYFKANDINFGLDLNSIYDHEVELIFSAFKQPAIKWSLTFNVCMLWQLMAALLR